MNNYYIVTNSGKDPDYAMTKRICSYITDRGCRCSYQITEPGNADFKGNYTDVNSVPADTECIIVLGGDGTIIQASRDLSTLKIPILGVNIGTIGYLSEIDMEQVFPAIDQLIEGQYSIDERMLLNGSVIRDEQEIYSDIALNDIVINRMGPLRVIKFDIYVNGEFLITYPADGLIIATPTGSTAYNLSAGGPIVKPEHDMIVMTPVCPHVLNKSSVIFAGDDVLNIVMSESRYKTEERAVTFDGEKFTRLISGDRIVISKSDRTVKLVRVRKHNFLQILRTKLS